MPDLAAAALIYYYFLVALLLHFLFNLHLTVAATGLKGRAVGVPVRQAGGRKNSAAMAFISASEARDLH